MIATCIRDNIQMSDFVFYGETIVIVNTFSIWRFVASLLIGYVHGTPGTRHYFYEKISYSHFFSQHVPVHVNIIYIVLLMPKRKWCFLFLPFSSL